MNPCADLALKLLEKSQVTIISSMDRNGFPCMKAMLRPRYWEGIASIHYMTHASTLRVDHYRNNDKAGIYLFDPSNFVGALLIGTMEVQLDLEAKRRVWRTGDEQYNYSGIEDANCCVLRFTTISGRLYRNFHSEDFGLN